MIYVGYMYSKVTNCYFSTEVLCRRPQRLEENVFLAKLKLVLALNIREYPRHYNYEQFLFFSLIINPFVPNAPFLYPLKTSDWE